MPHLGDREGNAHLGDREGNAHLGDREGNAHLGDREGNAHLGDREGNAHLGDREGNAHLGDREGNAHLGDREGNAHLGDREGQGDALVEFPSPGLDGDDGRDGHAVAEQFRRQVGGNWLCLKKSKLFKNRKMFSAIEWQDRTVRMIS